MNPVLILFLCVTVSWYGITQARYIKRTHPLTNIQAQANCLPTRRKERAQNAERCHLQFVVSLWHSLIIPCLWFEITRSGGSEIHILLIAINRVCVLCWSVWRIIMWHALRDGRYGVTGSWCTLFLLVCVCGVWCLMCLVVVIINVGKQNRSIFRSTR